MIPIATRLELERLIEQGVDLEALAAGRAAHNLQGFAEEADRVHLMVAERLEEARGVMEGLNQELEAMPFLEAEQLQMDNLERAAIPLEEVQVGLHEKLETGTRELHALQQQNKVLANTARELHTALNKGKGRYSFKSPIYNAGSMLSMGTAKRV